MEKKVVRIITLLMLALTVGVCCILINVSGFHVYALQWELAYKGSQTEATSVMELVQEQEDEAQVSAEEESTELQLRLELPEGVSKASITFDNQYLTKTIQILIPGLDENYFYDYPMVGSSDSIQDVTFAVDDGVGYITLELDQIYELSYAFEDSFLYIGFLDPHEVYDYIVVVDAGHGGTVPGASKQGVNEKDIDLDIVLALKEIFDASDENIGVYYTRLEDVNCSLSARVGLANSLNADLFLSIHNNSTASGRMSSISGTEVMYYSGDATGNSYRFAQLCLTNLLEALGSVSKGVVVGDSIYIIRESTVPVALVEVGFMTNKDELELLTSEEYQQQAAQALYDSIIQALEEFNE